MQSADYKAMTRALGGVEYELREQRRDIERHERLRRVDGEVAQGSSRAIRGEMDRQLTEVSALRRYITDALAVLRASNEPRAPLVTGTPPQGLPLTRWESAGWGPPTPHQVLATLLVISSVLPIVGLAPPGSVWAKLCEVLALVCGGSGIVAAKKYQSPQILNKLRAIDEHAIKELSTEGTKP